jgi:hypothetical protein
VPYTITVGCVHAVRRGGGTHARAGSSSGARDGFREGSGEGEANEHWGRLSRILETAEVFLDDGDALVLGGRIGAARGSSHHSYVTKGRLPSLSRNGTVDSNDAHNIHSHTLFLGSAYWDVMGREAGGDQGTQDTHSVFYSPGAWTRP